MNYSFICTLESCGVLQKFFATVKENGKLLLSHHSEKES